MQAEHKICFAFIMLVELDFRVCSAALLRCLIIPIKDVVTDR